MSVSLQYPALSTEPEGVVEVGHAYVVVRLAGLTPADTGGPTPLGRYPDGYEVGVG
jgi:hypothetical protein